MLKEHVLHGRIRHAYLFTGPQGVGRRTLALRFAQAINCPQTDTDGEPCMQCPTCLRIDRMQHPDLMVIKSDPDSKVLKVDQVRTLQRALSLSPYEARYKIALLLRFEEANQNAANALLKTLEEPASKVILLLTADNPENLLPTIVSRCEVLRLSPLSLEDVNEGLQTKWEIPPDRSRLLAHLSGGRPGYALKFFHQPELLEQRKKWLDDLHQLLKTNRVGRFAYAKDISKDKEFATSVLETWLIYWHDLLIGASRASIPIVNIDRVNEISAISQQIDLSIAQKTVSAIERTIALFDRNANLRLATEVLMLDLPYLEVSLT